MSWYDRIDADDDLWSHASDHGYDEIAVKGVSPNRRPVVNKKGKKGAKRNATSASGAKIGADLREKGVNRERNSGLNYTRHEAQVDLSTPALDSSVSWELLVMEWVLNNPDWEVFSLPDNHLVGQDLQQWARLKFADSTGDAVSMLNVFRGWCRQTCKSSETEWCRDNFITDSLNEVVRYVKSRYRTVHRQGCRRELSLCDDSKVADAAITQEIIKQCGPGLAIYRGHPTLGYKVLKTGHTVTLHPWSCLNFLTRPPAFILVLGHVSTSITTIRYAVSVDEVTARDIYQREVLGFDIQYTLDTSVLSPLKYYIKDGHIMQEIRNILCIIRKEISQGCDDAELIIEYTDKELIVYISHLYHAYVKDFITKKISKIKQELSVSSIEIGYPKSKSALRAVLCPGGKVQQLLFPHQFRAVHIRATHGCYVTVDYIRSCLCMFGELESVNEYPEGVQEHTGRWGYAIFVDPISVFRLISCNFFDPKFLADIATAQDLVDGTVKNISSCVENMTQRLRVSGFRDVFNGRAVVKFKKSKDYTQAIEAKNFQVEDREVTVLSYDKANQRVVLSGLNRHIATRDIISAFRTQLGITTAEVHIQPDTLMDEMRKFEAHIHRMLSKVMDTSRLVLLLQNLKPDDMWVEAELRINGVRAAGSCLDALSCCTYGDERLLVHAINGDGYMKAAWRLEPVHCSTLQCTLSKLRMEWRNTELFVSEETLPSGQMEIILKSEKPEALTSAAARLSETMLNSLTYKIDTEKYGEHNLDKKILQEVMNETQTYIKHGTAKNTLDVFGPSSQICKAFKIVDKYFEQYAKPYLDLCDERFGESILIELVKDHGKDLGGGVSFNINQKRIYGESSLPNALACVQDNLLTTYMKELRPHPCDGAESGEECQSCYLAMTDDEEKIILDTCGHSYCLECMQVYLNTSLESKTIPISCIVCDVPWSVHQLLVLVRQFVQGGLRKLTRVAVDLYAETHGELTGYCHRPRCRGLVCKAVLGPAYICGLCSTSQCRECKQQYHPGMSCQEFLESGGIDQWMEESSERQKCPQCGMGIERWDGCARVTCISCKANICWKCLEYFPTSQLCYAHLNKVHGNIM